MDYGLLEFRASCKLLEKKQKTYFPSFVYYKGYEESETN